MAADTLRQAFKRISKTGRDAEYLIKKGFKVTPVIEKMRAYLSSAVIDRLYMEFKTYHIDDRVALSINFTNYTPIIIPPPPTYDCGDPDTGGYTLLTGSSSYDQANSWTGFRQLWSPPYEGVEGDDTDIFERLNGSGDTTCPGITGRTSYNNPVGGFFDSEESFAFYSITTASPAIRLKGYVRANNFTSGDPVDWRLVQGSWGTGVPAYDIDAIELTSGTTANGSSTFFEVILEDIPLAGGRYQWYLELVDPPNGEYSNILITNTPTGGWTGEFSIRTCS